MVAGRKRGAIVIHVEGRRISIWSGRPQWFRRSGGSCTTCWSSRLCVFKRFRQLRAPTSRIGDVNLNDSANGGHSSEPDDRDMQPFGVPLFGYLAIPQPCRTEPQALPCGRALRRCETSLTRTLATTHDNYQLQAHYSQKELCTRGN